MRRLRLALAACLVVSPFLAASASAFPYVVTDSCLVDWAKERSGDPWDCEGWVYGQVCVFVLFYEDHQNPWWGAWLCHREWV